MNIIGKKFGLLTIKKFLGFYRDQKQSHSHSQWLAECDCGKEIIVKNISSVKRGSKQSCGCLLSSSSKNRMIKLNPIIDLQGKRFGRWIVLYRSESQYKGSHPKPCWRCRCDCGVEKDICGDNLRSNESKSCGCLRKEVSRNTLKKAAAKWKRNPQNHPNWNPKITQAERESKRSLALNLKWIKSIFQRDNYICRICGDRGGQLNAHHLDGYHWCQEKRFWKRNGVTLCIKCHKSFHKEFGKKNNTKEQFVEWRLNHESSLHNHNK